MLKACVNIVGKLWKGWLELYDLCTESTAGFKYLTSQVFFIRAPGTAFRQPSRLNPHMGSGVYYLLAGWFYTFSPIPMNATKLIKE
jgi:hypothetical protein